MSRFMAFYTFIYFNCKKALKYAITYAHMQFRVIRYLVIRLKQKKLKLFLVS